MAGRMWRVGELARETGVTVRTLHHYDRLGLVTASSRTGGGHRCYGEADVRRLHRVIALRDFGFTLEEIAGVLDETPDQDPRELVRQQLAVLDGRIAQAMRLRARLLGVREGLDRMVEPSAEEFLRLIEEMVAMNQPMTKEEFARMAERREAYMRGLTDEQRAEMERARQAAFAALSPAEIERMQEERRRYLPHDLS
ncbi:MerR family transcriptional regulator [Nocardia sp. ET3-3]|uniref:MerR family transcriptional regulator n=1 Tax=Nocardia terrae TaxID=2675851 RepID=A0A7K1UN86_9NOCA|nr:MerR family transcriptional regulator [Nocardia terrae]MVU75800.1 MerR family transcriptional regulator [Nocardia terrae]